MCEFRHVSPIKNFRIPHCAFYVRICRDSPHFQSFSHLSQIFFLRFYGLFLSFRGFLAAFLLSIRDDLESAGPLVAY